MNYNCVKSRDAAPSPYDKLRVIFGGVAAGICDAEFLDASGKHIIAAAGLPFNMPICLQLINNSCVCDYMASFGDADHLFLVGTEIRHFANDGERDIPADVRAVIEAVYSRLSGSAGYIDTDGSHVIDLKAYPVGSHFDVNLLLGNRIGFNNPLLTTPKSALDSFGRGSFRGAAEDQVLATRYVLRMEENGEPANRQFYLVENGRQIFYSADVSCNVKSAFCRHMQNRTVITYETECGLKIIRTIFILPAEKGMPEAVEAQRVEIENLTDRPRNVKIVFTGMFGIFDASGISGDIVYVNIVHESGVITEGNGRPVAITPCFHPAGGKRQARFALLLSDGEFFDEYCVNYAEFLGAGDIMHPENVAHLSSRQNRKAAPFFAMAKNLTIKPLSISVADSYAGISTDPENAAPVLIAALDNFISKYKDPASLEKSYKNVIDFVSDYSSYVDLHTDDKRLNSYISKNLPMQVLYQSFVTRAFAWTQKGGRQVGFREIQDMYASMYYMSAMGNSALAKDMISRWAENVWEDGYANHNFYWTGNGAGSASDDQLWLVQAVYRYIMLTGDTGFLDETYSVYGSDKKRCLLDTMLAAVFYSGKISVGCHGLPLLDGCDWNDCLCLDDDCVNAAEKMRLYRIQLEEKGQEYGAPWENHITESVMNAFLLKLALDELSRLCKITGREELSISLAADSRQLYDNIQKHAWKGDFFARCLINNPEKGFEYLGGAGDGLSAEPDFPGSYWLNSFSWSILSDCASEEQIDKMTDAVIKYIKTPFGLTLTSPCALDKISKRTAMDHYFHGDRENGAVFKHAAMMACAAMFKAVKTVKSSELAEKLAELAFWMLDFVLPYKAIDTPFVTKGNPRFCTQYNNSETGEAIGPMLSGTASWLALCTFEFLGISHVDGGINIVPILPFDLERAEYSVKADGTVFNITVEKKKGFARPDADTEYTFDGKMCTSVVPNPRDGKIHKIGVKIK